MKEELIQILWNEKQKWDLKRYSWRYSFGYKNRAKKMYNILIELLDALQAPD